MPEAFFSIIHFPFVILATMIQRIQTIYYTLAILSLAIPLAGMTILTVYGPEMTRGITLFGPEAADGLASESLRLPALPMFLGNLIVILMLILTIFSFKNLKRQASIGRITLIAYALLIVGFCVISYFLSQWAVLHKMITAFGLGFYFMLPGILFVLLGNRGVKSDRKLLDSLNRLR
jgi:hypothetical protein